MRKPIEFPQKKGAVQKQNIHLRDSNMKTCDTHMKWFLIILISITNSDTKTVPSVCNIIFFSLKTFCAILIIKEY